MLDLEWSSCAACAPFVIWCDASPPVQLMAPCSLVLLDVCWQPQPALEVITSLMICSTVTALNGIVPDTVPPHCIVTVGHNRCYTDISCGMYLVQQITYVPVCMPCRIFISTPAKVVREVLWQEHQQLQPSASINIISQQGGEQGRSAKTKQRKGDGRQEVAGRWP
jgi:hypothetical protein